MNKLNLILIWVFMVAMTCTGAMALESVSQYGISDQHQWWVSGIMGTAPYLVNWTDLGQDDNMPLVYDLNNDSVNEIIQSRQGTIKVYDLNGSVLASAIISGLGNRQVSAFDTTHCSSGRGIYVIVSNGDMSVQCLVNNTLVTGWLCNETALDKTTPDFTGASVSNVDGHNLAVFFYESAGAHYARFCDDTNSSKWETSLIDTRAQTFKGTPPHGNLRNDGYEYWVFQLASLDGHQVGVVYLNKIGNVTTLTIANYAGAGEEYMEKHPMIVKRGGGTADELLIPFRTSNKDRFWYGDATGYMYSDFTPPESESSYTRYSNPIQLGTNGDICFLYHLTSVSDINMRSSFVCRTPATLVWSYISTMLPFNGVAPNYNNRLIATDMNNDAFSDFFIGKYYSSTATINATLCLYTNHTNPLSCTILGAQADYIYGVDIGNDGYRDIVYSDSVNNLLKVFRTNLSGAGCGNLSAFQNCNNTSECLCGLYCDLDQQFNMTRCHNHACTYDGDCFGYETCINSTGGVGGNKTCTSPLSVSNCIDTDSVIFPTINYSMQGTMSATNIYNVTDYCSGDFVVEFYCDNATTYHPTAILYDCGGIGQTCVGGACVAPVSNGTCFDSDSVSYPTINYNISGVVSANNGSNLTTHPDFCLGNTLYEYYCFNSTNSIAFNITHSCAGDGLICTNGRCLVNTSPSLNCSTYTDSYSYPTLWLDTFGYSGSSILGHNWVGYPFVIGENYDHACNILFMNYSKYSQDISYSFLQTISTSFVFTWDMFLDSRYSNTSYVLNGMPIDVYFKNSTGDQIIHLVWGSDGIIYNYNSSGFSVPIGNWQGSFDSYKLVANMTSKTFNFYYTNSTNELSYVLGCANCTFRYDGTIKSVDFYPQPPLMGSYANLSVGVWLDNLKMVLGAETAPPQNITNFCYFTGCIFHDHFNYTDDTYTHGWYQFNTTPSNSIVFYGNSTNGYDFQHYFDTIRITDSNGIMSLQFRAKFPQPSESALDLIHFALYTTDGLNKIIDLEFSDGIILDSNAGLGQPCTGNLVFCQAGSGLGSYTYDHWNVYTMKIDFAGHTYDLYQDNNLLASGAPIVSTQTEMNKVGFWVNTDSSIELDYVTLAGGTLLVDSISNGLVNSETGVPLSDLRWCWSETNGTFNWNCCTSAENATRSMMCPLRVTGRYWLGSATTFVLNNFIYFLIVVILFVILVPFIVPMLRGQK